MFTFLHTHIPASCMSIYFMSKQQDMEKPHQQITFERRPLMFMGKVKKKAESHGVLALFHVFLR